MKSFLQAFNRPAYAITATSVSIDDLIDDLFGHNWIHRCESLSSQSTSTISRAIKWLSEQRNESDKQLLSLDRPDRQQQPDQWNQWFTEKQSRTRAFVKKNNGVLTINVACMVQTANEVVCS